MNFYDGKTLDDKIIENYKRDKNSIYVKYLYDNLSYEYTYTKNFENYLITTMIEQTLKRDEELYDRIYKKTKKYLIQTLLTLIPLIMSIKGEIQLAFCILFILGLIKSVNFIENYEKLKELKKYRLYFKMKDVLDEPENKNITKVVEFDPIHRNEIEIKTLDEFSLSDVKKIKKELKKRNKINKREEIV